jgi:AcrR family transcriptional regulator
VAERALEQQAAGSVSHNLNGQRLGRKGRDTRDRIIATAQAILSDPSGDTPLTLSEVARQASLRMSTLYLYFADLTELVLAILDPVMATAEDDYIHLLRDPWPDAEVGARALAFVTAYYNFWIRNARVLHLRNNMGDHGDERLMLRRVNAAIPVMRLIVGQMAPGESNLQGTIVSSTATALMTGLERTGTVMSGGKMAVVITGQPINPVHLLLQAEARLFELAIRDQREQAQLRKESQK